jgi:hypothetical protein
METLCPVRNDQRRLAQISGCFLWLQFRLESFLALIRTSREGGRLIASRSEAQPS